MTPAERKALLLLAGYVARLEGGLAKEDGVTSKTATQLEQLIKERGGSGNSDRPISGFPA
jgi:hypothetical protein